MDGFGFKGVRNSVTRELLLALPLPLLQGYFRRRGDAHAAGGHGCHNPSALIGAIMSTDGAAAHQQAHNQRKDVEGGEANEDGGERDWKYAATVSSSSAWVLLVGLPALT